MLYLFHFHYKSQVILFFVVAFSFNSLLLKGKSENFSPRWKNEYTSLQKKQKRHKLKTIRVISAEGADWKKLLELSSTGIRKNRFFLLVVK